MEYALLQKDRVVLAPSYLPGLDSRKKPQITTIFNMAVLFFLTLRHSRLLSEFICREVNILISVRMPRNKNWNSNTQKQTYEEHWLQDQNGFPTQSRSSSFDRHIREWKQFAISVLKEHEELGPYYWPTLRHQLRHGRLDTRTALAWAKRCYFKT